jgi:hypothetical protein
MSRPLSTITQHVQDMVTGSESTAWPVKGASASKEAFGAAYSAAA